MSDQRGYDPRSLYVERFWLPVLGPSTTWLIRNLNLCLERGGEDVEIDVAETGRALGLGERPGRHAPLVRALRRAADYDLIMSTTPSRPLGTGCGAPANPAVQILVRRELPPLSARLMERLPAELAREHHQFRAVLASKASPRACPMPDTGAGHNEIASNRAHPASTSPRFLGEVMPAQ